MGPKKYTISEARALIAKYGTDLNPSTVLARLNRKAMTEEEAATLPAMSSKEAGRKGGQFSSWQKSYK